MRCRRCVPCRCFDAELCRERARMFRTMLEDYQREAQVIPYRVVDLRAWLPIRDPFSRRWFWLRRIRKLQTSFVAIDHAPTYIPMLYIDWKTIEVAPL